MADSRRLALGRYDYAIFASLLLYAAGSVVVPVVLVELARDLSFPLEEGGMAQGGALHLARSVLMVVAMLLCGFVAGRFGLRLSVGWSVLLMAAGVALCAVSPGYGILLVGILVAGFGEGIIEGLATPFVQRLHPREPGRYINLAHAFWSVGVVAAVLLAGWLLHVGVSWRVITGAVAALCVVPAAMLLAPRAAGRPAYPDHPERLHWRTVRDHAAAIVRVPRFWLFFAAMFVAGGGEFCLTFWCASYIRLSFTPDPWAGGLGTACFAGGMVAGRMVWGVVIRQRQLPALVVWSAVVGVVVTLWFPLLADLRIFLALLFVAGLATAPFWPSVQSYCADRLPGVDTTMLFVLLSCAGIPGCGVCAWLMGLIGTKAGGLAAGFYIVPACYATMALLIGLDMRAARKERDTSTSI